MATTMYFDGAVHDQGGKTSMKILISVEVQQTAPAPGFRFPPLRALLGLLHCSAMTLPTRAWLLLNFDANQDED
jgi:hypothetical protein